MLLSNKRITKALISLGGCAGWSAALLFANTEDRFSRIEAQILAVVIRVMSILYLPGLCQHRRHVNKRPLHILLSLLVYVSVVCCSSYYHFRNCLRNTFRLPISLDLHPTQHLSDQIWIQTVCDGYQQVKQFVTKKNKNEIIKMNSPSCRIRLLLT